MDVTFFVSLALGLFLPLGILTAFIRRRRQKSRYYSNPMNDGRVEGTLDELNKAEAGASPWRNDEKARLNETMELIGRYDSMRGFTDQYVEDLKRELYKNGIAAESLFLEGYPVGALGSLTTRMGIFELYAERSKLELATKVVKDFKSTLILALKRPNLLASEFC